MSPQKCGVGTEATEVQRHSRAPGGQCKRRFWSLRSFYWTRLVCVPNDWFKKKRCYRKITRLWWTSSCCSKSAHKLEDAPRLLQIPYSECPDVWTRPPRPEWPNSWANIEDPVVPLERSLDGHSLAGLLLGGRKSQIGSVCLFIENKGYFCHFMWMTSRWLERSRIWLPCGRNWWKTWTWMNPHHFLTTCTWVALTENANRMKQSLNSKRKCSSDVYLLEQQKKFPGWQKPHAQTVAWSYDMEGNAQKMRSATLRIGKQESGAALQSFKPLPGWSSIQAWRTRISWRIVRSLLTNCLEMHVLDTNWTTSLLVVSQQACEISHRMDSGMWQTLGTADFVHSSHKRFPSVLSCGKHGTALQTGFVSRLRLCWRSWGLKVSLRRCLVYFGKQNILFPQVGCARSKRQCLTVPQNRNFFSLDAGLRMDGLLALDLWDIVIEVLRTT